MLIQQFHEILAVMGLLQRGSQAQQGFAVDPAL
jgi:hypothetical protein